MTGPPHSQLVPTSPIWSQLAPRSLAFSCQGVGVYRIQEICNCCCPHSKIMMWCWPWCVPIQGPKQAQMHNVLHHSCQLPVLNDGVSLTKSSWAKQKSWTCSYCVSSLRNRKCSKPIGFCDILVECTVCNKNLKPNQTPPRCWDLMPQVDSGPCKLHGRDNENWWKTALSSCIRGLTGQSVS